MRRALPQRKARATNAPHHDSALPAELQHAGQIVKQTVKAAALAAVLCMAPLGAAQACAVMACNATLTFTGHIDAATPVLAGAIEAGDGFEGSVSFGCVDSFVSPVFQVRVAEVEFSRSVAGGDGGAFPWYYAGTGETWIGILATPTDGPSFNGSPLQFFDMTMWNDHVDVPAGDPYPWRWFDLSRSPGGNDVHFLFSPESGARADAHLDTLTIQLGEVVDHLVDEPGAMTMAAVGLLLLPLIGVRPAARSRRRLAALPTR